jgi:hypothetical protein
MREGYNLAQEELTTLRERVKELKRLLEAKELYIMEHVWMERRAIDAEAKAKQLAEGLLNTMTPQGKERLMSGKYDEITHAAFIVAREVLGNG